MAAFTIAWTGVQILAASSGISAAVDTTGANFIAVSVRTAGTLAAIPVQDSFGNTYVEDFVSAALSLWIAENATCGPGHTITVSTTGNSNTAFAAASYSGMGTNSLDVSTMATGNSTALNSGFSASTATPVELVLGFGSITNTNALTFTAGTGFNMRSQVGGANSGNAYTFLEDLFTVSAGSQVATATSSITGTWRMAVATFKISNTATIAWTT